MNYYTVNFDGSEFEELDGKPDEWHYQYFSIFTDKAEALEAAYNRLLEHHDKQEKISHELTHDFKIRWLKLLYKYEPDTLRGGKFPAWYHNDVKEASDGTILL